MDKIKKYRFNITLITFMILIFGVYMVYDASYIWSTYKYEDSFYFLKRQSLFALLGIILFFVSQKISLNFLKKHVNMLLLISLILLILVLIPNVGLVRGGSSSWLGFSFLNIQPSEFFKITIILFFAKFIEKNYQKTLKLKTLLFPLLIAGVGLTLIMLQPDFGTCMVIIASLILMLFITRLKFRYFIFSFFILILFVVFLILLAPYRAERITSFIDPFSDPLGTGFQMIQSLFAITPGSLLGKGVGLSIQKYYYLPEPQTDFIFAIVVEEFGLIGGSILILLYGLLFYNCFKLITLSVDRFKMFFSLGLLALFLVQVLINLGVVTSLLPVTGITLPLVSYGGSSLCVLMFSLGLMIHE